MLFRRKVPTGVGVAVGASVAVNTVVNHANAYVSGSTLGTSASRMGAVTLTAFSDANIWALTLAGAVDAATGSASSNAVAVNVSGSVNTVVSSANAYITNDDTTRSTLWSNGDVTLSATDDSDIIANAGGLGVAFAGGGGTGNAVSVGPSVTINTVVNRTRTHITGSTVNAGGALSMTSLSEANIWALCIAGDVGVSTAGGGGFAFSLAASLAVNTVTNRSEALITNDETQRSDITIGGDLTLSATDDTDILSNAGGVSVGVLAGGGGGAAVTVGASVAVNTVANQTRAGIAGSTVSAAGELSLTSLSDANIWALSLAGAVSVSAGGGGGNAVSVGGAVAVNTVANKSLAYITNSGDQRSDILSAAAVTLSATEDTDIIANAGGVSMAFSTGGAGGVGASVGASVAVNTIANEVKSFISGSDVNTSGALSLTTLSEANIWALTIVASLGASVGGGEGGGGAGAASVSVNTVANTVAAYITNDGAQRSNITGATSVTLSATDDTDILANGGGVAGGWTAGGAGGAAGTVGASVSVNTVANKVLAYVAGSTLGSDTARLGSISLTALSDANVWSLSIAGAGAVTAGGASGNAFSLGASVSVNTVANVVEAAIKNSETEKSTVFSSGDVSMTASDDTDVLSNAGGVSFTVSGGGAGGGVLTIGASLSVNTVANAVRTHITGSDVDTTGALLMTTLSDANIWSLSIAGSFAGSVGGGGGVALSGAGAGSINTVANSVASYITNTADLQTTIAAPGGVTLSATDDTDIISNAGGVSGSWSGGGGGGVAATIGASLAVNTVANRVRSYVAGATLGTTEGADAYRVGALSLSAYSSADIWSLSVAGSGGLTTGGGGGLAASVAFATSVNTVANTVESYIANFEDDRGQVATTGAISLSAQDDTDILGNAGGIAFAGLFGGGGGGAVSVGGSVAVNTIANKIRSYIEESDADTQGALSLDALSTAYIWSLAIAGSFGISGSGGGGLGVAMGASTTVNTVANQVEAYITAGQENAGSSSASNVTTGGDLTLSATDSSDILGNAGNVQFAGLFGGGGGGAVTVGASVAVNTIANQVRTYISGSTIDVGASLLTMDAVSNAKIWSLAISGSLAIAVGGGGGVAVTLAASVAVNTIANTVESYIQSDGDEAASVTNAGGVSMSAQDNSDILGNAGGVTFSVGGGGAGGGGIAVGASVAVNTIANTVKTYISDATVTAAGPVALSSDSTSKIWALSIAGAGGASGGSVGGVSVAVAAAVTVNTVADTIEAFIDDGSNVTTTGTGTVTLAASDNSSILGNAGGVAFSGSGGAVGGVSVTAGMGVAVNTITNSAKSYVTGAETSVSSAGEVTISAESNAYIWSLSVAGAISGSGGAIGGVSVSGAGATSINVINNTIEAYISGGSDVTTTTMTEGIVLSALDNATIEGNAGGGAFSGSGGAIGGVSVTIGASVAVNDIDNDVNAYITGTDTVVTSAGAIDISATSTSHIWALAIAGTLSGSGGAIGGVSVSGAGAITTNIINNTLAAYVNGDATARTTGTGNIAVSALDNASITGNAGAFPITLSGGVVGGVSVSAGASVNVNVITNTVTASITDALVTSGGAVEVSAGSTAVIESLTMGGVFSGSGGIVGVSVAGGASVAVNEITNTIEAFIDSQADVSTGNSQGVLVSATDSATINSDAVTVGISATISAAGLPVSVGIVVADNTINNTVRGYIDDARVVSAGNIDVSATSSGDIDANAVATAVSAGISLAAISIAGSGAFSTNKVGDTGDSLLHAFISNSSEITAADAILVDAVDTATIDADVTTAAVSITLVAGLSVGLSTGNNTISKDIKAYAANATLTSGAGGTSITATSAGTISSTVVGTAVGVTITGISESGAFAEAEVNNTVEAYADADTVMNSTGDINIAASATDTISQNTVGVSIGLVAAAGESTTSARVDDTIRAYMDGTVNSGQNLAVSAASDMTLDTEAVAMSGGIFNGAGADADAHINPTLEAYIGNHAITVTNDVSVLALSQAEAEADAVGVSVGGISVGASLADATITPKVNASIGAADITATNGSIIIGAYHNYDSSGALIDKSADAHATAPGGSLLGSGLGADATADASAMLDAHVASGASLDAGGSVYVTAMSNNDAIAGSEGISGAIVASVGSSLADATAGGEIFARMEGTVTDADNLIITAHGASDSDAQAVAVSGGILSGAGADADANVTPAIEASTGSGDITVSGSIDIKAFSEGKAEADAVGVSAGGATVGASLADAVMTPDIDAHMGGGTISAGQDIFLGTYHNVGSDGTKITNTADAHATAAAGSLIGGTGGDATTNAAASLDTHVDSPASLTAGGNITVTSMANNDAIAGSEGVSGSLAAVGSSLADATAGGVIKARMEGKVADADNLDVSSTALSNANVLAVAVAGGIITGAGADADANVTPVIEASTGSNDITVTGDVNIQSFSDGSAKADAVGVSAGGVSVGASLADAVMTPDIDAHIAGGSITVGQNILLGTYHNMNDDGTQIDKNADAHATAPGGALVGGTGGDATADASAVMDTHVDAGAVLSAGNNITAVALANNDADAKSEGISGALVASVGVSLSDAAANGETNTRMMGAVTGAHLLTVTGNALNDATADAFGVAGGIIGAGTGADADATVSPDVAAVIGTAVITATQVDVTAVAEKTATADADGYVGGILGAGAALADAVTSGETLGHVDSTSLTADTVNISARTDETLNAHTQTGAGGILAGSGSIATVDANSTTKAYTGTGADITANDALNISASAKPDAFADAEGVNGGALAVGISEASSSLSPAVEAYIGENNTIHAQDFSVTAHLELADGGVSSTAHATASGGGLAGFNATQSDVSNTAGVKGYIADGSSVTVTGSGSIGTISETRQEAWSSANTGGIVAIGGNGSDAIADTSTRTYLGDDVTVTGGSLSLTAIGSDESHAKAVAGSGGIVAGSAAHSTTTNTSTTAVDVGISGNTQVGLQNALVIQVVHTTDFKAIVDTLSAGVVGASGATAKNTVDADVAVAFASGVDVNAGSMDVATDNVITKGGDEYDAVGASGGLAGGPASSSTTVINNETLISVGDGAVLETHSGDLVMTGRNDMDVTDMVKLDSGGAIAWAAATSSVANPVNTNEIKIGAAQLKSAEDVKLSSNSSGTVQSQTHVRTYGVAGAGSGDAYASVNADNDITLNNGAEIEAANDVILRAGKDNNFSVTANTDVYNKTAVPITLAPDAHGEVIQNSTIDIQAGAFVGADADIYLDVDKGTYYASGTGVSTDFYREVAAAMSNFFRSLFGEEPVSLKWETVSSHQSAESDVEVDGTVRAGLHNVQELIIGKDVSDVTPVQMIGGSTLDFSAAGTTDTISRDWGSWVVDGFEAGQYIAVIGSGGNDGVYLIASVGETELTLADQLPTHASDIVAEVIVVDTYTTARPLLTTGSPLLTFDRLSATITRSGGSWTDDGYSEGRYIYVMDSVANDGAYRITAISEDGLSLTVAGSQLANETTPVSADVVGLAISSGAVSSMTGNPDLVYVPKQTFITRGDGGSWLDDGFTTAGVVTIDGVNYTVSEVTATEIVLTETFGSLTGTSAGETVTAVTGTDNNIMVTFIPQQDAALAEINWSAGDWAAQGFSAGDAITISGSDANNGTYVIDTVSSTMLQLETGSSLNDDADDNDNSLTVSKSVDVFDTLTFAAEVTDGSGTVTAQATITRDAGSWLADGFAAGQTIVLTDAGTNSGPYVIDTVDATTIILVEGAVVAAETDNDGSTVTLSVNIADNVAFAAERFDTDAAIQRSTGNWDSAYTANQYVTITDAADNENNRTFRILSVSGNTMTIALPDSTNLVRATELADARISAVAVLDVAYGINNTHIERTDGSTWTSDGFTAGQTIEISGSGSDASTDNDGEYLVEAISGGGTILELDLAENLASDTETNSLTEIRTAGVGMVSVADGKTLQFDSADAGNPARITLSPANTGELWEDFGFDAGEYIQIMGSSSGNDGLYKIATVNANVIELEDGYDFAAAESFVTTEENNVLGLSMESGTQPVAMDTGAVLNLDRTNNTISRTDSVDWETAGFQANQYIVIRGTMDGLNDGVYRIQSIGIDDGSGITDKWVMTLDGATPLSQDELSASDIDVFGTTIQEASASITVSDGMEMPVLQKEDLAENIVAEIQALELQKADFSSASDAYLIDEQIRQLEYQLVELGLVHENDPGLESDTTPVTVISDMEITVIEVPEITVRSGDIIISGDNLSGQGALEAPGDARITIENHSPYYLRIANDLTVVPEGGNILFNGARVYDNEDIQGRNQSGQLAQFDTVTTAKNTADPLIEIRNTFNPPPTGTLESAPPPDIEIIGAAITNNQGTARVYNKEGSIYIKDVKDPDTGDIFAKATIQAKTIDIQAGRDVIIAADTYHVASDPMAQWHSESEANDNADHFASDGSIQNDAAVNTAYKDATGATIAGNNIFITARVLNVNGLVKSGNADRTLTITEDAVTVNGITVAKEIEAFEATGDSGWIRLQDSDIEFWYENGDTPDADKLIIDDVYVQGGLIKLSGHIMATDYGEIDVMDGYGNITIDNQTSWNIEVQSLNTGEDKELTLTGSDWRVSGADDLVTGDDGITFLDGGTDSDTIRRNSGSWITDGFTAGQTIRVSNANASENNGIYTIAVVGDKELTLERTDTLSNEYNASADLEISGNWITLADAGDADTITRSGGSWIDDGFFAGQTIRIVNSANGNDGTYEIAVATDKVLTLVSGDTLTNEVSSATTLEVTGNWLTFTDNGSDPHTITRSAGSWLEEGYRDGQSIIIAGTTLNDGEFTIGHVSSDGKTLELESTSILTNEDLTTAGWDIRGIGNGIEGKVIVADTAYDIDPGAGYLPRITTYTRIGNHIQVTDNDDTTPEAADIDDTGRDQTVTYQPQLNQRYFWLTGESLTSSKVEEWITRSFWGIDGLAADPGEQPESYSYSPSQAAIIENHSNYIAVVDAADNTVGYVYSFENIDSSTPQVTYRSWTTTNGWWIFSTQDYHLQRTTKIGMANYNVHSVKADYPITVKFSGYDTGTVSVTSDTDITLNGYISNTFGATTITSQSGSILQADERTLIRSRDITLSAAGGTIGYNEDTGLAATVRTDLTGGVLAADARGNVDIREVEGHMTIGPVVAGMGGGISTSGDVTLHAEGSIMATDQTSCVEGENISLTAATGGIGTASLALGLNTNGDGDYHGDAVADALTASASDDIFIRETAGDLRVVTVASQAGDITIFVDSGNLIDANTAESADARTIEVLTKLWEEMNLLDAAGSVSETQQAYKDVITNEYHTYWQYRNQMGGGYDPATQIVFSEEERQQYKDALGWDDNRIDLEEIKRTQEYHTLHERYGVLGDTHDVNWEYDDGYSGYLSEFDPAAAVDSTNDTVTIGTHFLTTGTGVLYHADGGDAVGYWEDGEMHSLSEEEIYYVIVVDDQTIRLALTQEDAENGIYMDLDASSATLSGHSLSDVDALGIGAQWTEEQLRYALGTGWLKETTDTETRIEAPNLYGKNITLNVSGSIGELKTEQVIQISSGDLESGGTEIELTDEQKAELAAVEREDLVSIQSDTNTICFGELHELASGDMIVFGPGGTVELSDVPGVTDGTTYYVRVMDEFTVQLFDTADHATGADDTGLINITRSEARITKREDIDIQAGGQITQISIYTSQGDMEDGGTERELTDAETAALAAADPEEITVIDSAANTITFGDIQGLADGDAVSFGALGTFAISNISGVIDGETYYARVVDAETIQLFDTADHAAGSDETGLVNITQSEIKIVQQPDEPFRVDITAGSHVFIGSETDINIGSVQAGPDTNRDQEVRIKTRGGIFQASGTGVGIVSGNLILEAGNKSIGIDGDPLCIDLSEGARLNARAREGIYLFETQGDMQVDTLYSPDRIDLFAQGSILDAYEGNYLNIRTTELNLTAGDSIGFKNSAGTDENYLDVDLYPDGVINAYAGNSIYLFETEGNMNVGEVISNGGDVGLRAMVSILDKEDELLADIIGNTIVLEAQLGGIGVSGNDLDIDSAFSASGTFSIISGLNAYITEVDGDLSVDRISTGTDFTAFIGSDGAIYNGRLDEEDNITSGSAWLFANDDIGAQDRWLKTAIGRLEGRSVIGSVWLENTGELLVSATYLPEALRVGGSLQLTSNSPIIVDYDVIAETGDIEMTSVDNSDNDDITVVAGVTMDAQNGSVLLQAGDNLIIEETAVVRAAGTVTLSVDHASQDPGIGGILLMYGQVTGTSITVFGSGDGDIFTLTNIISPTQVFARGGDDTLMVGSNATTTTNTGGHLHDIAALLDIDGGDGVDALFVDISGETEDVEGVVDTDAITGFGLADTGRIDYRAIDRLSLGFGDINGIFNIVGTSAETVLSVGDGDNVFNITSDPADFDSGSLDSISGDIRIQAGSGRNTLNISDYGSTDADTGVVLTRDAITGLASGQIAYETTGWFAGGINIWTGQGSDGITIESTRTDSFTTLWLGDGDDQVTVADDGTGDDGILVMAGEGGNDTIANSDPAAWTADMIVFGDFGEVLYGETVVTGNPMGTVYEKSLANMEGFSSDHSPVGGDDVIAMGSGRDVVIGGAGADTIDGQGGDDVLIGDCGRVTQGPGGLICAETSAFFTGGNDRLIGGAGYDLIMGGAGNDTLHGTMGEDILVGDNSRIRFDRSGKVLSIIRLGQGSLDLIAKTQNDLFLTKGPGTDTDLLETEMPGTEKTDSGVNGSDLVSKGLHLDQMRHGNGTTQSQTFGEAFSNARKAGKGAGDTFMWNGGTYEARLHGEAPVEKATGPSDVKEVAGKAPGDTDAQSQTFEEAFKNARKAGKRAGDTFMWNGGTYDAGVLGEKPENRPALPENTPEETVPAPVETKPSPNAKAPETPKIMTAVAGSLGWQLAKPKEGDDAAKIDLQVFKFFEKKMHRRQFREWTGQGFRR